MPRQTVEDRVQYLSRIPDSSRNVERWKLADGLRRAFGQTAEATPYYEQLPDKLLVEAGRYAHENRQVQRGNLIGAYISAASAVGGTLAGSGVFTIAALATTGLGVYLYFRTEKKLDVLQEAIKIGREDMRLEK